MSAQVIKFRKREVATCRGCGRALRGEPYYRGKPAFHPDTGEECPSNHYGGFVCSPECDVRAVLEMESSFPHAGPCRTLSPQHRADIERKWRKP